MSHRVLSHTADTGIEATAPTFPALIDELATGMFGLIATVEEKAIERWTRTMVSSGSIPELVVDALSELLWICETQDIVLCNFETSVVDLSASTTAGAVPLERATVTGPPIKAVTYHELVIEPRDAGWYGRVYFDV